MMRCTTRSRHPKKKQGEEGEGETRHRAADVSWARGITQYCAVVKGDLEMEGRAGAGARGTEMD